MDLLAIVGKLPEPLKNFFTTLYNNYVPLHDPTERRYYEVAYGLLASYGGISYAGVKRYVEHCLNEKCDEDKLKHALTNFDDAYGSRGLYSLCTEEELRSMSSCVGFTPQKINKLIVINREVAAGNAYRCTKEEALAICCSEDIEAFKADFGKTLQEVEEKKSLYFEVAVIDLEKAYSQILNKELLKEVLHALVSEAFFAGDEKTEMAVTNWLYEAVRKRQSMNSVASVALRALRFDAYKGKPEDYTTITEEDCRALISNYDVYVAAIAKKSSDSEKYAEELVGYIMDTSLFALKSSNKWLPDMESNPYFADAVCHRYWKNLAKAHKKSNCKKPSELCDVIWNDIAYTQEEIRAIEAEKRERARSYEEHCAAREAKAREAEEREKTAAAAPAVTPTTERSRPEPEVRDRAEANQTIYYYCFGPMDYDGVNVISYVNNAWAAKKAMLAMYGKTEADIKFWSGQERKDCSNFFDGRNCH